MFIQSIYFELSGIRSKINICEHNIVCDNFIKILYEFEVRAQIHEANIWIWYLIANLPVNFHIKCIVAH